MGLRPFTAKGEGEESKLGVVDACSGLTTHTLLRDIHAHTDLHRTAFLGKVGMWILMVVGCARVRHATWHGTIVTPYCICFCAFTKFCYCANDLALGSCGIRRSDDAPSSSTTESNCHFCLVVRKWYF